MSSKSSAAAKEKLFDEDEEPLQAVILADSFNRRFRPLTVTKPRCLLPICNAPLLDWTFESLALAGVQEVFVICRSHADLVKQAVSDSKWSKPGSGMKIVPIMTAKETFSPGDALRDIYTRGLVTTDFVLVMGDLVSNIRIDEVVRVHKERRKTNKDAIMTMVVKESGVLHRTRSRAESSVFVYDPETSECLHYQHLFGYPQTKAVQIPREILNEHPEVEIRNDLIDCSIDICSVEVPSLFQDNFDYADLRRDFVHGILTSDLLMKNIHLYIAKDGYAARVQDTRSYDAVSKDILSRWTFPLVPDDNHPGGHVYEHLRGNRYLAKDNTVILARTSNIGTNTLIGSSTHIAENVKIVSSVIGQNCTIGAGSELVNAYIFEGTTVGANCYIEQSIIGSNVKIKDGSKIPKGCLIGDGVILGPNAALEPFDKLSSKRVTTSDADDEEEQDEDEDSDIEDVENKQNSFDLSSLGADTNAILWPREAPDEEDDDEESPENWRNQKYMRIGDTTADVDLSDADSSMDEESSSDDEDDFGDMDSLSGRSDLSSHLDLAGVHAEAEFQNEVKQSLERAFLEGHSVDNAAVELKTLRMASNVPLIRVKEAVIGAIVDKIPIVEEGQREQIFAVIKRWGQLINQIGGVDPFETLSILQAHCASSIRLPLFGQVLAALYQFDIVDEEDIRRWHKTSSAKGDEEEDEERSEKLKRCWSVTTVLLARLAEQDEDSEEESDDDDGSDSGDSTSTAEAEPSSARRVAAAGKADASASDDSSEPSEDESEDEASKPSPTPKTDSAASTSASASDEESDEDRVRTPATALFRKPGGGGVLSEDSSAPPSAVGTDDEDDASRQRTSDGAGRTLGSGPVDDDSSSSSEDDRPTHARRGTVTATAAPAIIVAAAPVRKEVVEIVVPVAEAPVITTSLMQTTSGAATLPSVVGLGVPVDDDASASSTAEDVTPRPPAAQPSAALLAAAAAFRVGSNDEEKSDA